MRLDTVYTTLVMLYPVNRLRKEGDMKRKLVRTTERGNNIIIKRKNEPVALESYKQH